jgi:hypothetical protein
MANLYYISGILIFLSCLSSLLRFNRIYKIKEWYTKFKNITGQEPSLVDYRKKGDKKLYINHNFLLGFELIWIILGFFTNNNLIFLSILVVNLIINISFGKKKFTLPYKIISFSFLLLRTSLYLLLIVNHFYLHKDLGIIWKSF